MSAIGIESESQVLLSTLSTAGHGHDFKVDQLEMLPLTITKALQAPVVFDLNAVVVVLDRSGSMSGPKLDAAKESVRVLIEVLEPKDQVGVVAFDSEAEIFIPLRDASNRQRMSAEVGRLQSGGGTNIYTGLKLGFEMLKNVRDKNKFVILLTDGESPSDGIVELVQEMHAQKINIACVGLQGADRTLLGQIADAGEGRLYMVEDLGALPKIFMKESSR